MSILNATNPPHPTAPQESGEFFPPTTLWDSKSAHKKSVLIVCTGGTFASEKNADGTYSPSTGFLTKTIGEHSEFRHPNMPHIEIEEWSPALDSSDITPKDWGTMAQTISDNYYKYDGFVILHGTDTMAYTASALSFYLQNLAKPVILTGAQIPLCEVFNDAKRNLITAILIAANIDTVCEVCLFFGDTLFRGNRAKKVDSSGLRAFASPNFPPLARVGTKIWLHQAAMLAPPKKPFQHLAKAHRQAFTDIVVVSLVPGFDDAGLLALGNSHGSAKGLVLCLYGTGNGPITKKGFIDCLRKLQETETEIVITSQCIHGTVDLTAYATGAQLQQLGLIDGGDMTLEATVTKLSYLMSMGCRGERLKFLMETNLRGERGSDLFRHTSLLSASVRSSKL